MNYKITHLLSSSLLIQTNVKTKICFSLCGQDLWCFKQRLKELLCKITIWWEINKLWCLLREIIPITGGLPVRLVQLFLPISVSLSLLTCVIAVHSPRVHGNQAHPGMYCGADSWLVTTLWCCSDSSLDSDLRIDYHQWSGKKTSLALFHSTEKNEYFTGKPSLRDSKKSIYSICLNTAQRREVSARVRYVPQRLCLWNVQRVFFKHKHLAKKLFLNAAHPGVINYTEIQRRGQMPAEPSEIWPVSAADHYFYIIFNYHLKEARAPEETSPISMPDLFYGATLESFIFHFIQWMTQDSSIWVCFNICTR